MQLGAYQLTRKLGQGGMAEVWSARAFGPSGFERQVAIKRLLPELRDNPELQRALVAEARLGARLGHRNLIHVEELGFVDGEYFLRLELVEGVPLSALGVLPAELAALVAEELAHALAHLHAVTDDKGRGLGLVHRDVSPANVLVSRDGEVKLCDYGVAKVTTRAEVTRANIVKGKYAYMSPEQTRGEPLDAASDQFALAVLLVELCTGVRPFTAATPHATMELIARAEAPLLAGLSRSLQPLVERCLAPRPRDRFPSSEALCNALGEARRALPPATSFQLAARVRAA